MTDDSHGRPKPRTLAAMAAGHVALARRLAAREDRFSELVSRALADEWQGDQLVTRSGLTEAEHAEMVGIATEANRRLREELQLATARLRELLATGDPLHIVSVVQYPNLLGGWGEYFEPEHTGSEAKVELVCGLLATQPASTSASAPSARDMQAIFDELEHIEEVILLLNLSMPKGPDLELATIGFASRTRWMGLRGESFAEHGEVLARQVYGPQAEWLLSHYGFTIDDVIRVGAAVERLILERVASLHERVRQPGPPNTPAEMVAAVRAMEDGIRSCMTVTPQLIVQNDPNIDPHRVQAVLAECSVSVGSLPAETYTGLFDVHPLRDRPFLEHSGNYVLMTPAALSRDVNRLLEARLLDERPAFSQQRAKVLDRLAVDYLMKMLPGARGFTNLFYNGAELDGLVLYDAIALVVEGKASDLSVPARRGDLRRLHADLQASVEAAWRQGARAREYLLTTDYSVFTDDNGLEVFRLSAGIVQDVIIVNPTLHELAGFGPQLASVRAIGLFPEGDLPWSVFINDLRVISETAENSAVFLHYLRWRKRLPLGDKVTVSDEIDLWASYLLAERFGPLHDGGQVLIGNASTDFDAFYDGLANRGPAVNAPRKFLPDVVRHFINRMASERPPAWLEAAGACLDLSLPELAVVDANAAEAGLVAEGDEEAWWIVGRLALVGLPPSTNPVAWAAVATPPDGDPTFVVVVQAGRDGPRVTWATYRKEVTFELSDFERLVITGPDAPEE